MAPDLLVFKICPGFQVLPSRDTSTATGGFGEFRRSDLRSILGFGFDTGSLSMSFYYSESVF